MAEHCYAECHVFWLSLMLSVTYKPFMLCVVVLSVTYKPFMLGVIMLSVTYKPFMLSVVMLNAECCYVKFLGARSRAYPRGAP
jgi:hypothetical protein